MRRKLFITVLIIVLTLVVGCSKVNNDVIEVSSTEYEGEYITSDEGLFEIKLMEGYVFYAEEPNKYILMQEDGTEDFTRIEFVEDDLDRNQVKMNLVDSYAIVGDIKEMNLDEISHPIKNDMHFVFQVKQKTIENSFIDVSLITHEDLNIVVTNYFTSGEKNQENNLSLWNMISSIRRVND